MGAPPLPSLFLSSSSLPLSFYPFLPSSFPTLLFPFFSGLGALVPVVSW